MTPRRDNLRARSLFAWPLSRLQHGGEQRGDRRGKGEGGGGLCGAALRVLSNDAILD